MNLSEIIFRQLLMCTGEIEKSDDATLRQKWENRTKRKEKETELLMGHIY